MKVLSIVIHAGAQQALADNLRLIPQINSFSFSHVEGHSDHSEADPFLSARDKVVGYVPRVQVDILLNDEEVNHVLESLQTHKSLKGQARYWVTPVEQSGRI